MIFLNFVYFISSISKESIVDIKGKVTKTPSLIGSCSQQNVELHIEELWVISQAASQLPLLIEDASRPIKDDEVIYCTNLFVLTN